MKSLSHINRPFIEDKCYIPSCKNLPVTDMKVTKGDITRVVRSCLVHTQQAKKEFTGDSVETKIIPRKPKPRQV